MGYQNGDTTTANTDVAFKGWMASSGHCLNIMAPQFTVFGVAYHDGEPVTGSAPYTPRMWSMELGSHT
ncbi:CAP domain-containing protein [Deinococcus altitudinis]|uniref:CAP domain-containing protein n=1 Tax=Deinococcus altitudinis TaxID=468914 RepID=UPI0038919691